MPPTDNVVPAEQAVIRHNRQRGTGRTRLAHKVEHAVDFSSGAVVAVTLQPADAGDTATGRVTVCEAGEQIATVAGGENGEAVNPEGPKEVVLDKGYHSNEMLVELADGQVRSYCSEPDRGPRNWEGKQEGQAAVYANRRRIRGERGKWLLRQRGEKVERSFAHCYETGEMRRVHLRHHRNILKRLLVHVAAFNLGLVMRKLLGHGTPRGLQGYDRALFLILLRMRCAAWASARARKNHSCPFEALASLSQLPENALLTARKRSLSATGC